MRIGNDRGSVLIHALAFDGLQESTLIVESQWPGAAFIEGIGINVLVSAEPGFPAAGAGVPRTRPSGCNVLNRRRPDHLADWPRLHGFFASKFVCADNTCGAILCNLL